MTTTLLACEQELSRQIGDYWSSTTTSAGSSGGTTLIDTALKAEANDWITDETWVFIEEEPAGGATSLYEERKASSLDNSSGTITNLAFAEQIASGIDYSLHRLFSPSEKRRALVAAARRVFPGLFQEIWNEELVSGNWLNDGSFERWSTVTNLTQWIDTTLTTTRASANGYVQHGVYSCQLDTATGTLVQEWRAGVLGFEDLRYLRGQSPVFTCQARCDTASALRLSINDGVNQTYSAYHAGDSAWTQSNPRNDSFYVQQYIDPNATRVTFTIHLENAGATAYVDDARVIAPPRSRLYIGHLGLAQNRPHGVYIEPYYSAQEEDWVRVSGWKVDDSGYLYLPTTCPSDRRLRIRGVGYLDFLVSGVSSTAWTATINIDQPQLEVLVAEAALYLYTEMSMPNFESGTRDEYQKMASYWAEETRSRKAKFGMIAPPATISFGV